MCCPSQRCVSKTLRVLCLLMCAVFTPVTCSLVLRQAGAVYDYGELTRLVATVAAIGIKTRVMARFAMIERGRDRERRVTAPTARHWTLPTLLAAEP